MRDRLRFYQMKTFHLIALLCLSSCAAQTEPLPADPAAPDAGTMGPDAAPDAVLPDVGTAPEGGEDASSQDGLGLPDAPGLDVATADVGAAIDARGDIGADAGTDARDGAIATDVRADSALTDAATDAGDSGLVPICTAEYPACLAAIATDARVRETFTAPCSPLGLEKCGGLPGDVTETVPLICHASMWRLSGYMSGTQWMNGHGCTMGCQSGKICNP